MGFIIDPPWLRCCPQVRLGVSRHHVHPERGREEEWTRLWELHHGFDAPPMHRILHHDEQGQTGEASNPECSPIVKAANDSLI